ncbi:MFS transporter [Pueribacillus sp. YX66]|uniref:MFS transporter n=1 Tax=Pueribacillus sp. YX66 TaxID=3229242 RepID=UPI00358D64A3
MKTKRRWYYGWNIVIAASIVTLITVGMRMSIGPFFLPLLEHFHLSRTSLSLIVAIGMFVYGVGMPLAGYLEKRFGTRIVLVSGTIIVFLSSIWTIFTETVFGLFLSFGFFMSFGLAFTSPVALTPVISRWFVKKRGQALFYLSTGSMTGIAVMNPVNTFLIEMVGWQWTFFIFAMSFLLLVLPTALFIIRDDVPDGADGMMDEMDKTNDPHPQLTVRSAIKTLPFWQVSIGLFACGYSMNLLGSHGIPMLVDHGFSEMTASFAIGLIGIVAIPSTIVLGKLSDRLQRKNLLAVIYFVRGLGFIFLVSVTVTLQLYLIAFVAGFVWAGSIALSSAILSDLYGVRLVGILYGWAYFSHQVAATISSLLGGWGYEQFHTHLVSFGSAAVILLIAAIVSYMLPSSLSLRINFDKNFGIVEKS